MFLRRVALTNIRSIGHVEIHFGEGAEDGRAWTYVLGENGAGKSTVLKATGLALAGSEALFDLLDDSDAWIRLGTDEARIEVDFATAENEARNIALDFVRGENRREFIIRNSKNFEQLDSAIAHSTRNHFVAAYGVMRHAFSRKSGNSDVFKGSPRARAVSTLYGLSTSLVSLEDWAMDLDYRRGDSGMEAVTTALNTLLPDVTFAGIDKDRRALMFDTEDGTLPLSALSDGYQAMAAWIGDLLYQITETFEDYRNPLDARGLLLVDEIDMHLHPQWQRRLVSFIKDTLPNIQVVATTHSALTVHQAGEGELFLMNRNGSKPAYVTRYDGAPNKLMLHQLLQSPLFGLETLDSPQIQAAREEARRLQGIGSDSASASLADVQRLQEISALLEDTPSYSATRPDLAETNQILAELTKKLGPKGTWNRDGAPVDDGKQRRGETGEEGQ